MIEQSEAPEIGDVITSSEFAQGWWLIDDTLGVGFSYGCPVQDLYEPSRAQAHYVVSDKTYTPASEGSGECWFIKAVRLKEDGSFDPGGEKISFYVKSDYYLPRVDVIKVVGRMRPVLTFEKIE